MPINFAPIHITLMAKALLNQLNGVHPREEIDLDAVRAVATWAATGRDDQEPTTGSSHG